MDNNELTVTESTASTAPPPAVTAPASTTTITTVPFINNTPVESNGTAFLPAILEPHPINVGYMPAPTHDMRKCAIRGCPRFPDPPCIMEECAFGECNKQVHHQCYTNVVCKSTAKNKGRVAFEDISFCTAAHHDMYAKRMSEDNLSWTNDGANGRDDPLTSQYFLIKWLSTGENYHTFRSPTGGRTKIDISSEIATYINLKGVKVTRTSETVQAKIGWVQGCMRETYDFTVSPTGEGIQQNEGFDSLEEKVSLEE